MQYRWVALSVTTVGTLMASIDTNIVVIALPTIARQLPGVSVIVLLWILIGYSLVTSVLLLSLGRVADLYGRVRLYTWGLVVFTLGSALCGLSELGVELVAFRIVQALGAALLFANSTAIVTDAFPPHQRGMALGINQISIVVGSVSGLVFGGLLTAVAGWRAIFFVNVPIGAFAVVWARWRLKELAVIERGQPVDWPGNATFAGGLTLLLVGVTFGVLRVLSPIGGVLVGAAGLALLAIFVEVERRSRYPMLDVRLFRVRLFAAGNVSIFLNALARGTFAFVMVFFLQGPPRFLDPLSAGLYLAPVSASLAACAPFSGWLSDRYGARGFATGGLALSAVGFLLLTQVGPTTTFLTMLPAFLLVGAGMGFYASPNRASIMNSVPAHRRGVAAGTSTTLVTSGTTFSLAFSIATLSTVMSLGNIVTVFLGRAIGSPSTVTAVGPFVSAVHLVFGISAGLVIAAMIPSALRGSEETRSPGSAAGAASRDRRLSLTRRPRTWEPPPSRADEGTAAAESRS